MSLLKYAIAFQISSLALYGCGSGQSLVKQEEVTKNASEVIPVQLNDMWNVIFPSQSFTLTKDYRFTPPSSVFVVGGSFAGHPGQYLRARIKVGAAFCEYQNYNTTDATLNLQTCYGLDDYESDVVTLASGTVIELQNYDAPGLLLETQFVIAR